MSKREKVIIFVMLAAVVYAVYTLFLSSPSKTTSVSTGKESKALMKLVTEAPQDLTKEKLSETDTYIIARAEEEWMSNPFLQTESPIKSALTDETEGLEQRVHFAYSGYLKVGDYRLAIINGLEYKRGEELAPGGYILWSIRPTNVVIEWKQRKEKIIVPFQEKEMIGGIGHD